MTGPVIGIDLGTTNTVVAAVRDGQATALENDRGEVLIPSVVSFHPSGSVLVGPEAKNRRKIDPNNTIYSVKRLIGRSWDSEEVRVARERFPFEMREGPGQSALVVARKETYTLPEISAFVLRKAKSVAEAALGTPVERAVITVPANFNDLQRAATKVAGRVAGLEVIRILNEPTAAALAYGYGKLSSERIAVYDFGGGTLDITLLDLSDNVFEVLATAGNTFLGGDDIDHVICDRMADVLLATHRVDAKADPTLYELLRWSAEDIKKQLTSEMVASITIPEVAHQAGGRAIDFSFSMTRAELEQLITPIVAKTFDVCREAIGIARLDPDAFSQVLLVGGSTRIPLVRAEVERFFGTTPITTLNPDEVVALGAAIQANALSGAEKRRSQLPLPPNPAARARLSTHPGARPRQSGLPPSVRAPDTTTPPVDTASYGRPRLPTARGLQPATPAAQPLRARAAPLVAPPAAGQPSAGVPVTADIARTNKRTTALGLGGPPAALTDDSGRAQSRSEREVTRAPEPHGPHAPSGATLRSAAEQAALARSAAAATSDVAAGGPAPFAFDIEDDAPTEVRSALGSPQAEVATRATEDFLDAAELEELPHRPPEVAEEEEEITRARHRPPVAPAPALPVGHAVALPPETRAPASPTQRLPARPAATLPLAAPPAPQMLTLPLPAPPVREAATAPLPVAAPAAPWGAAQSSLSTEPFELPTPGIPAAAAATYPAPAPGFEFGAGTANVRQVPFERPEAPLLIDVTPLTLAVETVGGYCDTVIARNSPIPCENSRQFATVTDNQDSVRVRVSQGEAPVFAQNTLLGEVLLSGLRAAPRGGVKIEVAFALDPSGMLNVNATDIDTGRSVSTRIRLVGLADAQEVETMRARQAALHLR